MTLYQSKPKSKELQSGIRSQVLRSQTTRKWWAKRWMECIEFQHLGARLGRGRSYAMAGQVMSIDIEPGKVTATVGEEAVGREYKCEIDFPVVDAATKKRILGKLLSRPTQLSQLLMHDFAPETEALFGAEGCQLLPASADSICGHCTCHDRVSLCKHVAAVYFILIETIEQDPMQMLVLHGITLRDIIGREAPDEAVAAAVQASAEDVAPSADTFWRLPATEDAKVDFGAAPSSRSNMPLIHRLGAVPFWRGDMRFMTVMDQCGERAAQDGWSVWAGESARKDDK